MSHPSFFSGLICAIFCVWSIVEIWANQKQRKQRKQRKWSELPEELVVMIGERLSMYPDFVRFRSVCKSWYSANYAKSLLINNNHQYFPLLLLPPCYDEIVDEDGIMGICCSRGFLSLPENSKIYHLRGLPIMEFKSIHCRGSSHGWLVIACEYVPITNLINPFTRAQLPLPPINTFFDMLSYKRYRVGNCDPEWLRKVVLSSSFSSSSQFKPCTNVVAIAIFDRFPAMAFSRPGDKAWIRFTWDYIFKDVIFSRDDHLYAVGMRKTNYLELEILVFHMDMDMDMDMDSPLPKLVDTIKSPEGFCCDLFATPYLVESCGELLLVARDGYKTVGFRIFKLCPQGNNTSDDHNKFSSSSSSGGSSSSSSWVEIHNLGDRMLFLGVNSSLSLSSHDLPGTTGNCIYFTNQYYDCDDVGVFNLKDKRIEPLPLKGSKGRLLPSPIWLTPNPN